MSLTAEYRDATYDVDKDFDRTTSWNDGIQEKCQFVPNLPRPIRRSNSSDDIDRFKRYFTLARSNQGKFFTWKCYLDILRDELRQFDTMVIMTKVLVQRLATPVNSEVSNYITASESDSSKKTISVKNKSRKISFKRKKGGADAESVSSADDLNSSMNSNLSLTPQTNLLKKMCTEIRTLARKTCKTVEKISTKSKYCSACGDYIGSVKIHKDCSQPFLGLADCAKPLTPSMLKGKTNIMKTRSLTFESPLKTPTGDGEIPLGESSKITFAPNAGCRMKPFIKKSSLKKET